MFRIEIKRIADAIFKAYVGHCPEQSNDTNGCPAHGVRIGRAGWRLIDGKMTADGVKFVGCGKSTLLRLANGLAPRFFSGEKAGNVMLDGTDVDDLATWEIACVLKME